MQYFFEINKQYLKYIESIPAKSKYEKKDLLIDSLCMNEDTKKPSIKVYYIPFDYYEENAKISLVGITPGWTQMELAIRHYKDGINKNFSIKQICENLEEVASFGGTMRNNLISMLDGIDIPKYLNIKSSAYLFSNSQKKLHTTSILRYPVFLNNENYTGHSPKIQKNEMFRNLIETNFIYEINRVKGSLIIPMGQSVSDVLQEMVGKKLINEKRCLFGFPHPSGANGHRKKQFEERKHLMNNKAYKWFENITMWDK